MKTFRGVLLSAVLLFVLLSCSLFSGNQVSPTQAPVQAGSTDTSGLLQPLDTAESTQPVEINIPTVTPAGSTGQVGSTATPVSIQNGVPQPMTIKVSLKPTTPPNGYLAKFTYFAGGQMSTIACFHTDQPTSPEWINNLGYNDGASVPFSVGVISFCAYGLNQASGSVTDPDGNSIKVTLSHPEDWPNTTQMDFQVAVGMPLGKYTITLKDSTTTLTDTFNLSEPSQPGGFIEDQSAWFSGFAADETLQIVFYEYQAQGSVYSYLTQQKTQADSQGMLLVSLTDVPADAQGLYIEAIGASGECTAAHSGQSQDVPCGDAMNAAVSTPAS